MKLEEARELFKDGDIFFVKNKKGLISWLIRVFTKSKYTHAGIVFWLETGDGKRLMCVEAQGGTKRRVLNFSFYNEVDLDVYAAPKPWDEVRDIALRKIGVRRYGYLEAVYVGLRESLLQYFDIRIPSNDFPGEICSEFIANVYGLKERHISPQLLCQQLEEIGCTCRLVIQR